MSPTDRGHSGEKSKLQLWNLPRWNRPVIEAAVQAIAFTGLLQIYLLLSPIYMRLVLDEVITRSDEGLLRGAATGFALLAVFNALAGFLRSFVTSRLSALLSWDMSRRVLNHLLRLPMSWFGVRKLGDTLGRLQGLDHIRMFISGGLGASIDGVMSVALLGMLAYFSPKLALVAAASTTLSLVVRLLGLPIMTRLNRRAVLAANEEQGIRIETVRTVQTIKVMVGEANRERYWSGKLLESLRTAQASASIGSAFSTIQGLIGALAGIFAIYAGAREIMSGDMTVGVLTAALAYQSQFSQRTSGLVEQLIAFRMLDVHLARLDEIVSTPIEVGFESANSPGPRLTGGIEVKDLSFSYGDSGNPLFTDLSVSILPGEHVAIVGASGAGKSTLLKLLCGLYSPATGEVLYDGNPVDPRRVLTVRRSIGVVLQDEDLMSGTIAENVCFFDDLFDGDQIWRCLEIVDMASEVREMKEGIHSSMGDMGATISAGQKQRLLLARALYKRPSILLLDEATSNLPVYLEEKIVRSLSAMDITRVVAAHRPNTIQAADRVLELKGGRLHPVDKESLGAPGKRL